MINKILDFVAHNGINVMSFSGSSSNGSAVYIAGYALHIGLENPKAILVVLRTKYIVTEAFEKEFLRVFPYCMAHNYGAWWSNPTNKEIVDAMIPPESIKPTSE